MNVPQLPIWNAVLGKSHIFITMLIYLYSKAEGMENLNSCPCPLSNEKL